MAQEQFAGPEHYTEFDPEKFLRDMNLIKEFGEKGDKGSEDTDDSQNTADIGDTGKRDS
ncbi:hypothetical protein [Corynebacterium urinipleomorphum]|uniref:hypothetical protein n=1 Tax=Corynebacterium urinipleomorphum TaxID=1852380 RepID=UPI0012B5ED06|nr:hypothetical protein [Corynebacterium urinipleomorphum]